VMRWTTMILGHLKIGQAQKALEQFWQMQHLTMCNQTWYLLSWWCWMHVP
jgi:hypothetical protein